MEKCPQCGYSAPPDRRKRERKHFNAHWLECSRCGYMTETKPSFAAAEKSWNFEAIVRRVKAGTISDAEAALAAAVYR